MPSRLPDWWSNGADKDEAQNIEADWISERCLRAEMTIVKKHPDHIPAAIQIAQGMIPDAVVMSNKWVNALEVELTPKKPEETRQKLERLCRATYRMTATGKEYVYNLILFYVPDKATQHHLERACTHLHENDKARIVIKLDANLEKKH